MNENHSGPSSIFAVLLLALVLGFSGSETAVAGGQAARHGPIHLTANDDLYFLTTLAPFTGMAMTPSDPWVDEPFVVRLRSGVVLGLREGPAAGLRLERGSVSGPLDPIRRISDPGPVYQTMGKVGEGNLSNGEGCSAHVEFWDSGNDDDEAVDVILVTNTGSKDADVTFTQGTEDESGNTQTESATESDVPPGGTTGTEVDEGAEFVEVGISC